MAQVDLGSAHGRLELDISSWRQSIERAQGDLVNMQQSISDMGSDAGIPINNLRAVQQQADNIANSFDSVANKIGMVAVGGSFGLAKMIKFGFDATRQIQDLTAGITALTGSSEEAGRVIQEMIEFVQGTPFDRVEVIQASRNLLAMGRTTKDLTGDIELLSRAAIFSGRDFQDLSVIYGQMAGSGRVMGGELRQLEESGIPVVKELAEVLGLSTGEVRELASKSEISFAQVREALENVLPADIVERNANTINQRMSSLSASFRDLAFDILGVDFDKMDGRPLIVADGLLDNIVDGIELVIQKLREPEMRESFERLGEQLVGVADVLPKVVDGVMFLFRNMRTLVGAFLAFKSAAITARLIGVAAGFVKLATGAGAVGGAVGGATVKMWGLNVAMGANPIGAVIAAVAALVGVLVFLETEFGVVSSAVEWASEKWSEFKGWLEETTRPLRDFGNALADMDGPIGSFFGGLRDIVDGLRGTEEPVDEFRENLDEATSESISNFAQMSGEVRALLGQMSTEGVKITGDMSNELSTLFDNMGEEIVSGFREQKDEYLDVLTELASSSEELTAEWLQEQKEGIDEHYDGRIKTVQEARKEINRIEKLRQEENREFTAEELLKIQSLQDTFHDLRIEALQRHGDNERELLRILKDDTRDITHDQAAELVEIEAKRFLDIEKAANESYVNQKSALDALHHDLGSMSEEDYLEALRAAREKRDAQIEEAGKTYAGIEEAVRDGLKNQKTIIEIDGEKYVLTPMSGLMQDTKKIFDEEHDWFSSGSSILQQLNGGMRSQLWDLEQTALEAAGIASGAFPQSPAEYGPFSGKGYTLYRGKKMIEDFGSGISMGSKQLQSTLDKALRGTSMGLDRVGVGSAGGAGDSTTYTIENITLPNVEKPEDFTRDLKLHLGAMRS